MHPSSVSLFRRAALFSALRQTPRSSPAISHGERTHTSCVEDAILQTARKLKGGYALVIISPRKLIGVRDPLGLKPLCLGKRGDSYILASESCALTAVDAEFVRDILPGEIVTITENGIKSDSRLIEESKAAQIPHAHCIFEYIYFARLDSTMDNVNIYDARIRAGKALAASYPVEADLVTGVPDSGLAAAMGYAQACGLPFALAFHKKTAMWEELSSNPPKRSGSPLFT